MIEIKNLKFSYSQKPILDIPEISIKSGEVVFLHGPSGSGKSTLLELLAGILKADSGDLVINQKNLSQMSLAALDSFRADSIGYIFQSFNLIPYLSVMENIMLPFLFRKADVDTEDLNDMLSHLGLAPYVDRPVSRLSVGQQQRVAVVRALIKKPQIILADEPTSALDYDRREGFLKILFSLCRKHGTTVVFVSHDLSIAKLFDRSIGLSEVNQVKSEAEV
ncbi:ABC transporter ATP-binding protein [Pseudobdellovibrio exovorus]|uniref:Peptide ABC transporter ATPase n=1 Tax=Pseudobdellovibrio exovorus JSS TaxID=1184267 RepID=M4V6T2_9BACT|nr:ABC transporter ATP-binding protein [Pseudobdellovibrio exovorus]AGH95077.1 peptide ABC transporter ATPase [Pseudobdellovibrio exovorus JSS]